MRMWLRYQWWKTWAGAVSLYHFPSRVMDLRTFSLEDQDLGVMLGYVVAVLDTDGKFLWIRTEGVVPPFQVAA